MTKMPLERQKNVQNTPKTQKMTDTPQKHKKNDQNTPKTSK